jgi:chromate transporter
MAVSPQLLEVARVFLTLGTTAFGGPAAHMAAMEDEVVTRRQWLSRDDFADLVGAANLIPGPNSTELAIHLGYRRAGWAGLVVAGSCFLVPAVAIVWLCAMAYGRFGARVEVAAMLQGMQPAVLAVVVQAIWRLKGSLVRSRVGLVLAVLAFGGVLAGASELLLLLAAIVVALAWAFWRAPGSGAPPAGPGPASPPRAGIAAAILASTSSAGPVAVPLAVPLASSGATLGAATVFVSFAKIGSVLFGSGYVLLAFLRGEFVDAVGRAVGRAVARRHRHRAGHAGAGFLGGDLRRGICSAGHTGAAAATLGIFLPAFVGVALTAPLVSRLRTSPITSWALDAVNAVSLALHGVGWWC